MANVSQGNHVWDDSCKVYIGNIGSLVTKDMLMGEFEKFGRITNIWVARNPPGFAFLQYSSREDALDAVHSLNGGHLFDHCIKVQMSTGKRYSPVDDRYSRSSYRSADRDGRDRGGRYYESDRDRGHRSSRRESHSRVSRDRSRSRSPPRRRHSRSPPRRRHSRSPVRVFRGLPPLPRRSPPKSRGRSCSYSPPMRRAGSSNNYR